MLDDDCEWGGEDMRLMLFVGGSGRHEGYLVPADRISDDDVRRLDHLSSRATNYDDTGKPFHRRRELARLNRRLGRSRAPRPTATELWQGVQGPFDRKELADMGAYVYGCYIIDDEMDEDVWKAQRKQQQTSPKRRKPSS